MPSGDLDGEVGEEVVFRFHENHKDSRRILSKFLLSLWEMLSDPNFQDEVCWSDDGTYFVIKDTKGFSEKVLPVYFKHGNLNSFIRQLHNYEFTKVFLLPSSNKVLRSWNRRAPYAGLLAFQHSCFCRDRPEYLPEVRRKHCSDGMSVWQAITQINLKMDNIVDKMKILEDRMSSLESQHVLAKNQCQKLGNAVQCMFSAMVTSHRDPRVTQTLNFLPRFLLPDGSKQGPDGIQSSKKRRIGDTAVNELSTEGFLRIASDGNNALVRRSQLPFRDRPPSVSGPDTSFDQQGQSSLPQECYAVQPQCNALVVRNPAFSDTPYNVCQEEYQSVGDVSMDELSKILADYKPPEGNSNLSIPNSVDPILESSGLGNAVEKSAMKLTTAPPGNQLPKWTPVSSPQMFDFPDGEDLYLGTCDLLCSPLNTPTYTSTSKAILPSEKNPQQANASQLLNMYPDFSGQTDAQQSALVTTNEDALGKELAPYNALRQQFIPITNFPIETDNGNGNMWTNTANCVAPSQPIISQASQDPQDDQAARSSANIISQQNGKLILYKPVARRASVNGSLTGYGGQQTGGSVPSAPQSHTSVDRKSGKIIRFSVIPRKT